MKANKKHYMTITGYKVHEILYIDYYAFNNKLIRKRKIILMLSMQIKLIIVGKFVYKLNIIYRIYLSRNRNILSPCNPELVDLLDI